MTKRNRKTKSGLQTAKAVTDPEMSKELSHNNNPKAEKTKPRT
ncbi:hypothetical protein ACFFIX_04400 [Metabacillus herbersteinensis]|uniref:YuzL family protein n=1 Tax=Metabacillus herbersteinensis TaxID=283816 RepID=A0ABV6GAI9_9BACI